MKTWLGLALATTLASAPSDADADSLSISVDSCVGQLLQVEHPGAVKGIVLSVDNQTTRKSASVTSAPGASGVTINSAGDGSFAVTVGPDWTPTLIAMAGHPGYTIAAFLAYHKDGPAYVLEDFRLVQGFGPHPDNCS